MKKTSLNREVFIISYIEEKFSNIIITSIERIVILNKKIEFSNIYELDINDFKKGICIVNITTAKGEIFLKN